MHKQISRIQFVFLLLWLIMGTGILTMPFAIAHFTIHDGWLVPLMFMGGSLVSVGVCLAFVRIFPGCSITEGFEMAFGTWGCRILGMWLILMLYVGMCMVLRELSLFIEISILPRTPLFLVSALVIVPLGYGMTMGVFALGRLAEFITPMALLLGAILTLLALQKLDWNQFQPVLEHGWRPVYRGGLLPATGFAFQFIFALQFVKSLRDVKKLPRDIFVTSAALSIVGCVIMVSIIGVLGGAASYLSYPVLELVRSIRVGEFLERFDTIYVMGVVVTIVIKLGVWEHVWLSTIEHIFRLPSYRNIAVAATAAVWAGNVFLFHDSAELAEFMVYVTPSYFGVTLVGLPMAAVVVHNVRTKLLRHRPT